MRDMVPSAIQDKARDAYKLLKKNYRVDGLCIRLHLMLSGENLALHIEFVNTSNVIVKSVFGDANGEVEQGQLILTNAHGERVIPTRRQRIDNREDDLAIIEIGPQSQWTYSVEGTLVEGLLSLRGVIYELTPNEIYHIQYQYPFDRTQEYTSNIADLNVLSVATAPVERVLAVAQTRVG